jgi:hypothetical protein
MQALSLPGDDHHRLRAGRAIQCRLSPDLEVASHACLQHADAQGCGRTDAALIDMAALTPEQQETVTTALRQEPEAAHPPTLCAWLETEADIDRLARAIARFLIGPGPEGEPIYWRYFDPRVFSLAMHLFSPSNATPCWVRSRSGALPGAAIGGASRAQGGSGSPGRNPARLAQ